MALPGLPVDLVGAGERHAAFLTESRTRSLGRIHEQEIPVGIRKKIHGIISCNLRAKWSRIQLAITQGFSAL
jgi:hypothetical protein